MGQIPQKYKKGTGVPDTGILIMGSDGTNTQAVAVNSDGELKVNLETADIEIGAVEIKDGTTDTRAVVDSDGVNVSVKATVGLTDTELRATPVPVSLSSDIEIGAVELKNGADDTRASIEADSTKNAVYVQSESLATETTLSSIDGKLPSGGLASETTLSSIDTKTVKVDTDNVSVVSAPNLSETTDKVGIYGSDDGGTTMRLIKTDSGGAIQVDLEVADVGITSNSTDFSTETTLGSVKTAVESIDTKMTSVDTSALALETGGNLATIKTNTDPLASLTNTTVGSDVGLDVNIIGGSAEAYQYANDADFGATDEGFLNLAVRRDADTTIATATGKYAPLQVNAGGQLKTAEINSSAIKTALEIIDDWDDSDRCKTTELNSGDIKTSIQIMDDWDDGDKCKVSPNASTTGGASMFFDGTADESAQQLKSGAGNLYSIHATNTHATDGAYIQLFDVANGSVSVGTTTPNFVLFVPANSSIAHTFPMPANFATAINYACTATPTGAGAPSADLVLSALYK